MTNTDPNRLEEYLATAVAGSLIGQIARKRDIAMGDLFASGFDTASPTVRALATELDDLGIDAQLLASQSLLALVALFAQESNADLITGQFTALLWSILGDPKNGGSPPEIYRRAGVAMHLALLGILDPSIVGKHSRS